MKLKQKPRWKWSFLCFNNKNMSLGMYSKGICTTTTSHVRCDTSCMSITTKWIERKKKEKTAATKTRITTAAATATANIELISHIFPLMYDHFFFFHLIAHRLHLAYVQSKMSSISTFLGPQLLNKHIIYLRLSIYIYFISTYYRDRCSLIV